MTDKKVYKTVDAYIEAQGQDVQEKLKELKDCIMTAVPEATEMFNYGIPAFALVEGGKRDQQIMIAGYKKHVGLYPHPTVMEKFDKPLEKYKKGKGSVQFPLDQALPKDLIIDMVRYRYDLMTKG